MWLTAQMFVCFFFLKKDKTKKHVYKKQPSEKLKIFKREMLGPYKEITLNVRKHM